MTPADAEAYQLMSKHFNESYGGRALLELEEDVCSDPFDKYVHDPVSAKILCACRGVLFHAIPPDKRYTEMDAVCTLLTHTQLRLCNMHAYTDVYIHKDG